LDASLANQGRGRGETGAISPRPSSRRFRDARDPEVGRQLAAALAPLPFLGELTTETAALVAGEVAEVVLRYRVGAAGIADSGWLKLCFRYYSDWDLQTADPAGRDYVSAEVTHRGDLGGASAESLASVRHLAVTYDVKGGERPFQKALLIHLEDGFLRPGDEITIRLGDRRGGGPGTRVQTFVEDHFTFRLFADVLGTSRFGHVGDLGVDIVAGPAERLVAGGPRVVRAGSAAPLHLHLEDRWGNVASDTPATVSVSVAGESDGAADGDGANATAGANGAGRAGADLGLDIELPASGWATGTLAIPPLPLGAHRVESVARLADGRALTATTPLDVIDDLPGERAYFADLHAHSDDTVGTQDTAYNLDYGRRVGGLDVLGYTANDFQIPATTWADVVTHCRAADEPGRFVCYPGVEWCGNAGVGGDHNVVFLGEDTTLARSLEWHDSMASAVPTPEHWPITELYAAYAEHPEDYLLIPHLGGRRAMLDWHQPELERLLEVHSAWGTGGWFLRDALARGLRIGASASSDEHRGRPGAGAPGANIFGARGGLTGVLAPELSRAAVGKTLRARRTWATTGTRAVALLRAGERWMGDEVAVAGEPIALSYALYGDAPWEELTVFDSEGPLLRRDLLAEGVAAATLGTDEGAAPSLVRIRFGGARHRDRYRWASWRGGAEVRGARLLGAEPWAFLHPEQTVTVEGERVEWAAQTFGGDVGVVLRLGPGEDAEIAVEASVVEDGRTERLAVSRAELSAGAVRRELGGAGLHLTVEPVTPADALPLTLAGELTIDPPRGDSAVYLHARQADGHEVWTSPLFFIRDD
jgi:hypothetical protein